MSQRNKNWKANKRAKRLEEAQNFFLDNVEVRYHVKDFNSLATIFNKYGARGVRKILKALPAVRHTVESQLAVRLDHEADMPTPDYPNGVFEIVRTLPESDRGALIDVIWDHHNYIRNQLSMIVDDLRDDYSDAILGMISFTYHIS